MFNALRQRLAPAPEQVTLVRFSLNQPVVATAEVAPGPARAAILVHCEGGERLHTVVVRSVRDGDPVLYRLEEPDLSDDVALDASLSFAESMGFLFDDEAPLDPRSREGAETLAALDALLGNADPADLAPSEILLEQVAARSAEAAPRPGGIHEEPSPGPAPSTAAATPVLSKFRLRAPGPAVGPTAAAASAAPVEEVDPEASEESRTRTMLGLGRRLLGRVRPVRRKVDAEAPGPVLRMLSWF